jgi:hypothetical protein
VRGCPESAGSRNRSATSNWRSNIDPWTCVIQAEVEFSPL